MRQSWTEEEEDRLIELYPVTLTTDLPALFNRSMSSINWKAYSLGLRKEKGCTLHKGKDPSWTEEEIEILRRDFPHMRNGKVPINRTPDAIKAMAHKLGIKKSRRYVQKCKYAFSKMIRQGKL